MYKKPLVFVGCLGALLCVMRIYSMNTAKEIALIWDKEVSSFSYQNQTSRKEKWKYYSTLHVNKIKRKRLPDVLGIGVKKCGTSSIIQFLGAHPFIKYPPDLEVFFFNHKYETGLQNYKSLMPMAADHELIMEKTPAYLDCPPINIPERINKDLPRSKLILVLCDPVKRSYSDYVHEIDRYHRKLANALDETKYPTFDSYLDVYLDRVEEWTNGERENIISKHMSSYYGDPATRLLSSGFYSAFIPRFSALFNSSRLLFVSGEAILQNPGRQIERMQEYLGIPKLLEESDFVRNPKTGFFCLRPYWKSYDFAAEQNNVSGWENNLICLGKTKGRTKNSGISVSAEHLERLKLLYKPFNDELKKFTNLEFNW